MEVILLVSSICACIFGVLGLVFGITALIKVQSFEKSTHSVQWIPENKNSWGMDDKDINKLNADIKDEEEELII